jgi:hypothetical protein
MSKLRYFTKYQLSDFHDHPFQEIMALFLVQTDVCKDIALYADKKTHFFDEFHKFLIQYYHLNHYQDAAMYFASSLRKEKRGAFNAAGGGDKRSHASKVYLKTKYRQIESAREDAIDEFAAKYGIDVSVEEDPRLFVGVTEIWRKLDQAREIVALSKWADVASRSYSDDTFQTPLPKILDKSLVPLSIRTKVTQLHQTQLRAASSRNTFRTRIDPEEEEEIHNQILKNREVSVSDPDPVTPLQPVVFVPPSDIDWEDW